MTIALYPKRRGFTLAELLVAMGITVLLLTLLVSVTGVALDGWRISRNKVRASRQAKAALDQLSRDFESMVARSGNKFEWFYAESEGSAPGPTDNESPNAAHLIFFTAATDRYNGNIGAASSPGGDVSTVGYRLFYKDPITDADGTPYDVFALYRKLVNPDETFEKLLAKEDLERAYRTYDNDLDDSSNFVCENIFEMSVVFLVEYADPSGSPSDLKIKRVPILATAGSNVVKDFRLQGTGIVVDGDDGTDFAGGRIVAVDISLTVLTDGGMATIKKANFKNETVRQRFLAKNSYHYSKTILLPQP